MFTSEFYKFCPFITIRYAFVEITTSWATPSMSPVHFHLGMYVALCDFDETLSPVNFSRFLIKGHTLQYPRNYQLLVMTLHIP